MAIVGLYPGVSRSGETGAVRARVLVVDDDPQSVRLLGKLLTAEGYRVHVADSGEVALTIAKEIAPDLVLLDIRMPSGLDGIETCRRLKARPETRCVPVIFLTGSEDQDTMVKAFDAGGSDYVLKPFDARVLIARVRTHSELYALSRDLESALTERTIALDAANARLRKMAIELSLVEERERKQLATGLHDSPMQKLALAQMYVTAFARRDEQPTENRFNVGLELMREALHELRSLQFELSPPILQQEGLEAALAWLAASASQRFGVAISFKGPDDPVVLEQDLAVVLFRCVKELIHNVAKHAEALTGSIEFSVSDGEVSLVVQDDGKGFQRNEDVESQSDEYHGHGLRSVRERLALRGGDLSIRSGGEGTRVTVRAPVRLSPHKKVTEGRVAPPVGSDPGKKR